MDDVNVEENEARFLTHSGSPHVDEIYAIAALIVSDGIMRWSVERLDDVDPDAETGTGVYIVDIGGIYDPSRECYDHHQIEEDDESALSLVVKSRQCLQQLYYDEHTSEFMHTVDRVTEQDNHGLKRLADNTAMSAKFLGEGFLTSEHILKNWFRRDSIAVTNAVSHYIQHLIDKSQQMVDLLKHLRKNSVLKSVNGTYGRGDILIIPWWPAWTSQGPAVQAVNQYMSEIPDKIRMTVSRDLDRNKGCWTLFRTTAGRDHYDLSVVEYLTEKCVFCHSGKYLAILEPDMEIGDLLELIETVWRF